MRMRRRYQDDLLCVDLGAPPLGHVQLTPCPQQVVPRAALRGLVVLDHRGCHRESRLPWPVRGAWIDGSAAARRPHQRPTIVWGAHRPSRRGRQPLLPGLIPAPGPRLPYPRSALHDLRGAGLIGPLEGRHPSGASPFRTPATGSRAAFPHLHGSLPSLLTSRTLARSTSPSGAGRTDSGGHSHSGPPPAPAAGRTARRSPSRAPPGRPGCPPRTTPARAYAAQGPHPS